MLKSLNYSYIISFNTLNVNYLIYNYHFIYGKIGNLFVKIIN